MSIKAIYMLHYIGGPHDGHKAYSPRPYDRITETDGTVYEANHEGVAALEPRDDSEKAIRTIDIHLHYKPNTPSGETGA